MQGWDHCTELEGSVPLALKQSRGEALAGTEVPPSLWWDAISRNKAGWQIKSLRMVILAVWNRIALIHGTWGLICLQVHLAFKSVLVMLFTTWNRVKWTGFFSKLRPIQLWSLVQPPREKQPASCKLKIFIQVLPSVPVKLLICVF